MKKAIFLHPVSEVVGGIEIKNQLLRWRGKALHEEFDKQSAQFNANPAIDSIFESTQSAWSSELTIAADNGLNQRIASQFMMVIEVFMARHQP